MDAPDLGKLLLRVNVAGLMLFHGAGKLAHGVSGIGDSLANHGLPRAFGYGVLVGEVVAPLLIILGIYTRPAALVLAFNMVVAVLLAHTGDLFKLGRGGGYALELQAFYLVGAIAIALLGP